MACRQQACNMHRLLAWQRSRQDGQLASQYTREGQQEDGRCSAAACTCDEKAAAWARSISAQAPEERFYQCHHIRVCTWYSHIAAVSFLLRGCSVVVSMMVRVVIRIQSLKDMQTLPWARMQQADVQRLMIAISFALQAGAAAARGRKEEDQLRRAAAGAGWGRRGQRGCTGHV